MRWLAIAVVATACGRIGFDPSDDTASKGCELPVPWDRGISYARTVYVAPTGDDGADGSSGAPRRTIAGARSLLTPGTRLVARPGVYAAAYLPDVHGTLAAPVAITGEDGAVIDGVDRNASCLDVDEPSYVVIDTFRMRNCYHGVYGSSAIGATGLIVRNLTVEDAEDGIKLYWIDDAYVEANTVQTARHDGVFAIGVRGATIANNTLSNSQFAGIQLMDGSTDVLVAGNRVLDAVGVKLSVGGQDTPSLYLRPPSVYQAERIRVVGNFLAGSGRPHVSLADAADVLVTHNTIYDPSGTVFAITHENPAPATGSRNATFEANLIYFDTTKISGYLDAFNGNEMTTMTMRRNLWWATNNPSFSGGMLATPVVEESPIYGIDPQVGPDGHVTLGSQAIGTTDPAPDLRDLDGTCFGSPSTPGADEP